MLPAWVYTFIAVGVTVVWLAANIVALLQGTRVDGQLHVLMGAVVGAAFGGHALARRRVENERVVAQNEGSAD